MIRFIDMTKQAVLKLRRAEKPIPEVPKSKVREYVEAAIEVIVLGVTLYVTMVLMMAM